MVSKALAHPFNKSGDGQQSAPLRLFSPQNPIPGIIRDPIEQLKFYENHKIMPYALDGSTPCNGLRRLLIDMPELSSTHGSCIQSQSRFCFSQKPEMMKIIDFDMDFYETDEASEIEKREFSAFKSKLNNGQLDLRDQAKHLFKDYKSDGNAWLKCTVATIGGKASAYMEYINTSECVRKTVGKYEIPVAMISPLWDDAYLRKHPAEEVPLYPNFVREGAVSKTMIQIRCGSGLWYGRPDSIQALTAMLQEYYNATYLMKLGKNNWAAQFFLEFEDYDAEQDGNPNTNLAEDQNENGFFEDLQDKFRKNFTNNSPDPDSFILSTRPKGADPAFIYKFDPNTNEKLYTVIKNMAENDIIKAHGWLSILLGESFAKGLSTNLYKDAMMMVDLTTITDYQETIARAQNIGMRWIAEQLGINLEVGIEYKSLIEELIERDRLMNTDNNPIQGGDNLEDAGRTENIETDENDTDSV